MEESQAEPGKWQVWGRQILAVISLSNRRFLFSRFFWTVTFLAAMPIVTSLLISVVLFFQMRLGDEGNVPISEMKNVMEAIFQGVFLHFGIFFCAFGIGSNMIREEMDEQTLHYFFLQPMPRWIFLLGKLLSNLIIIGGTFTVVHLLSKLILVFPLGFEGYKEFFTSWWMIKSTILEVVVIFLSLLIYSTLFLAISSVIKNLVYGLFLFGWELSTNYLPETLRNFSLVYHLREFLPHKNYEKPPFIGLLVEGPGAIQVILVLGLTFVLSLAFAGFMLSRRECLYGKG